MLSIEIEPQYLAHDEDGDAELVGDDSMPQQAVPTHSMILDGVVTMPGSGMEGDDDYGEEGELDMDNNQALEDVIANLDPDTRKRFEAGELSLEDLKGMGLAEDSYGDMDEEGEEEGDESEEPK